MASVHILKDQRILKNVILEWVKRLFCGKILSPYGRKMGTFTYNMLLYYKTEKVFAENPYESGYWLID